MATLHGSRYNEPWRGLPAEIRWAIIRQSVHYPQGIHLIEQPRRRYNRFRAYRDEIKNAVLPLSPLDKNLRPGILGSCKEAYSIGARQFYSNTFVISAECEETLDFFKRRLRPSSRSFIRHIHLLWRAAIINVDGNWKFYELADFVVNEMSLDCFTLYAEEAGHDYLSGWFYLVGRAVIDGRQPQLRLAYEDPILFEETPDRKMECDIEAITKLYRLYESAIDDTTCESILHSFDSYRYYPTRSPHTSDESVERVAAKIEPILREHRSFYPFTLSHELDPSGDTGSTVVMTYAGLETAKRNIRKVEELAEQDAYHDSAQSMDLPFVIPSIQERLTNAKRGLARYEIKIAAAPGSWWDLDMGRLYQPGDNKVVEIQDGKIVFHEDAFDESGDAYGAPTDEDLMATAW